MILLLFMRVISKRTSTGEFNKSEWVIAIYANGKSYKHVYSTSISQLTKVSKSQY